MPERIAALSIDARFSPLVAINAGDPANVLGTARREHLEQALVRDVRDALPANFDTALMVQETIRRTQGAQAD